MHVVEVQGIKRHANAFTLQSHFRLDGVFPKRHAIDGRGSRLYRRRQIARDVI